MTNRFTILIAALLALAAPRPALAVASPSTVFDTVDGATIFQSSTCISVGCFTHTFIDVTGILTGQATATTREFDFGDQADVAAHCQRLAMVAMSKPGKFRLGIGADASFSSVNHGSGACSLKLVAP